MIRNIYYFFYLPIFLIEIFLFKFFKIQNSERSLQMMIFLFGKFGGRFNKKLSNFLAKKDEIKLEKLSTNIDNKKNYYTILNELNENGYSIVKKVLNDDSIISLKKSIISMPGTYSSDDCLPEKNQREEYFDIKNPKGVRFVYSGSELLKNPFIQNLAFDKTFLEIAQSYLGCLPVLDIVGAWWSSPGAKPDITAAQFWHHDMDRPRWIKIFIYLTDCDEKNGPHEFIRGSHKNNGIPKILREKGYVRLNDETILEHYSENDIIRCTAKAGDLILEDTIGLHKGKQLIEGNRLMLNFQYSSCSFGSSLPKIKMPKKIMGNLSQVNLEYPHISSKLID